jgi:hypothetical protein
MEFGLLVFNSLKNVNALAYSNFIALKYAYPKSTFFRITVVFQEIMIKL